MGHLNIWQKVYKQSGNDNMKNDSIPGRLDQRNLPFQGSWLWLISLVFNLGLRKIIVTVEVSGIILKVFVYL